MNPFILLMIGLVGQWGLGLTVAAVLLRFPLSATTSHRQDRGDRYAEWGGLGLVLGIAVTSYLSFLWSLCGGQLGRPLSLTLTAIGLVAGAIVLLIHRIRTVRSRRADPNGSLQIGIVPNAHGTSGRALCRTAVTLILFLIAATIVQAVLTPQRLWDERAIFGLKAEILFVDRSIDSPALLDPDFVQYHPRYPLLLPLAEQHIYALLGTIDDRWSKLVSPLLYAGMVLTFAGVLTRHMRSDSAWLFALLLATVPALMPWEYGFLSVQADAPVACFHAVALLYLWDWFQMNHRDDKPPVVVNNLLIAGLSSGMTIFTKDEGIALFAVDAFAVVLIGLTVSRLSLRQVMASTGLFVMVVTAITAPWFLQRSRLPSTTEMSYFSRISLAALIAGAGTLWWSVPHLIRRMFAEALQWGLAWWASLLALMTQPRRAREPGQLLLLFDVAGALAALLIAGMIAPTAVQEHIGGSSHRFLIQLIPVAVLFVAGQWGCSPRDRDTPFFPAEMARP